ncbi:thymidine phosphorylase [Oryzifoliimicrobium ureilyticus]|uniref:thymidine phosphorylase n=1 Tax=Oryzifoliimicrobium ureilyticus TaxID=3113724 RepID=UPI003076135B
MLPQEIIRRKRDGEELSAGEIEGFIAAITSGGLSEAQIGAFAMAVRLKGMSRTETVALTLAMAESGDRLQWNDAGRPVADKHSTGGVGDNVSLMLAPIAAACGLAVPMISGRGLGHTGGTLDKLESIPGYSIAPDHAKFRAVVRQAGCAIVGQTASLAPADRTLYAIRDVTATVDSPPLITASILSKKLAAGLDSLVLDVKVGSGAFMGDRTEAMHLAGALVEVANGAGLKTSALVTDMNEPLADAAGNTLEVIHCLDVLTRKKAGTRSEELILTLAAEMLVQAGLSASLEEARTAALKALDRGDAAEHFAKMVFLLGGPSDLLERPSAYLAVAPTIKPILAPYQGYLTSCDARAVGMAVIELGGGRRQPSDRIDHTVGFSALCPLGSHVEENQPIAFVHAADDIQAERAAKAFLEAYTIDQAPEDRPPLVLARLG